jgi:hypothetical protein
MCTHGSQTPPPPLLSGNIVYDSSTIITLKPWVSSLAGADIFPFTSASITALGTSKPSIQWVSEALSPGIKWPKSND